MKKILWADLEMTGLNEQVDSILEVAFVITDLDFKNLEEFHRIIFQKPEILIKMNDWCKEVHNKSGLLSKIPYEGVSLTQVQAEIQKMIQKHFSPDEKIVLAGNSIWNDRRFIDRYFPEIAQHLHYRMIDVSSYKEIFRNKFSLQFNKKNTHRALEDIYESIQELSFYLSYVNKT